MLARGRISLLCAVDGAQSPKEVIVGQSVMLQSQKLMYSLQVFAMALVKGALGCW